MGDKWTEAFGRYLRMLRERQGLSLQDVASLSQPFAERLTKGYISRAENGRVRLAVSKVAALSHIYKVSPEVLHERIDLDMELERVGAPDTAGMSLTALREAGKHASDTGFRWQSYAYLRQALEVARVTPLQAEYCDLKEQVACAVLGTGTAAMNLGRNRFALHEFRYVEMSRSTSSRYLPLVLERLATAYRHQGDLEIGRAYSNRAIEAANTEDGKPYLGYAYSARASQALADRDLEAAGDFTKKAHDVFSRTGLVAESARALSNLAQIYFDLGQYGAARRALLATEANLRSTVGYQRHRALALILLGEIDAAEQREAGAAEHWRGAAGIAKALNDKTLQFKAEYQLFRQAHRLNNAQIARSIERRLVRLSNYIPPTTPELPEFRRFQADTERAPFEVAKKQQPSN